MAELSDFRALCEAYIAKVKSLEQNRKPGEGIFGLKGGPADDPCHDRFADDLRAMVDAYASEEHRPEEVREVLSYLYTIPQEHREPKSAYWMLVAVHGLTLVLVGALDPASAAALRRRYETDYPRWERLPVQKQVLAALRGKGK